jgi:hypothetical protein
MVGADAASAVNEACKQKPLDHRGNGKQNETNLGVQCAAIAT